MTGNFFGGAFFSGGFFGAITPSGLTKAMAAAMRRRERERAIADDDAEVITLFIESLPSLIERYGRFK